MRDVSNMRKSFLCLLLLAFAFPARPAAADPLRITSGVFALDIEGDIFTFNGSGFSLTTTGIGIYSTKQFPGRCDASGSPFGFCAEAAGDLADWSFQTIGGEQLLGKGNVLLGGVNAADVEPFLNLGRSRVGSTGELRRGTPIQQEIYSALHCFQSSVGVGFEPLLVDRGFPLGSLRDGPFTVPNPTIRRHRRHDAGRLGMPERWH
jgi:hypothetical protein